jgi:hypothetical protein
MKLQISPKIISSVASLYNDTNRIFMEYIDNSIDSAEQFFDREDNSYSKDINIDFYLDKKAVSIVDNCYGITNIPKIVQSIGDSDKKTSAFTNGQFGYGIYSFMAACNNIEIISKLKNNSHGLMIPISRAQFDVATVDDVIFDDPKEVDYIYDSGTKVTLSKFDKQMYKDIDFNEIKSEVEKHFELLLNRKNLTITLHNAITGLSHICKSFDYDEYEGEPWEDVLNELTFTGKKNQSTTYTIPAEPPVHIYLKILKGKAIKKPPVFISKGRRIGDIKSIKGFKTKYKSEIWGHPSITGYIDLNGFLEPTIARDDFRNNNQSKALFSTLLDLEDIISAAIKDVNKASEQKHYKSLEQHLNKVLSKLAKIDALNFRTENITGNDINLDPGGNGQDQEEGAGSEHHRDGDSSGNEIDHTGNNDDPFGFGPSDNDGNNPSEDDGSGASNKEPDNPFEDTGFRGGERKKSGFNIEFVDGDPIWNIDTNKPIRSQLIGGTIRIFREHSEFQKRIKLTLTKEPKISERLITYIAGEITVHYKDKIQSRVGQAEYNVQMFENLVEFIYMFEDELSDLAGKNLSDLGI